MKITTILEQIPPLARAWAAERAERQERTSADQADFDQLRRLGVPLMAVPVECGGTWESLAQSARPICTMLRILAQGDPLLPWPALCTRACWGPGAFHRARPV